MLGPWKCSKCGRSNDGEKYICNCGLSRARIIYNDLLVKHLFERTGPSGHSNWEILQRYAWAYARERGIPSYLVEDAFCRAIERLVASVGNFNWGGRVDFRTWAISFVRNEIRTAVKKDLEEAGRVGRSLDLVTDDGEIVAESIEGSSLSIDDIVKAEMEVTEKEAQRRIASAMLGSFATIVGRRREMVPVYMEALKVFDAIVEESSHGWIAELSRRTGISRQTLHARTKRATELWEKIRKQIMEA